VRSLGVGTQAIPNLELILYDLPTEISVFGLLLNQEIYGYHPHCYFALQEGTASPETTTFPHPTDSDLVLPSLPSSLLLATLLTSIPSPYSSRLSPKPRLPLLLPTVLIAAKCQWFAIPSLSDSTSATKKNSVLKPFFPKERNCAFFCSPQLLFLWPNSPITVLRFWSLSTSPYPYPRGYFFISS